MSERTIEAGASCPLPFSHAVSNRCCSSETVQSLEVVKTIVRFDLGSMSASATSLKSCCCFSISIEYDVYAFITDCLSTTGMPKRNAFEQRSIKSELFLTGFDICAASLLTYLFREISSSSFPAPEDSSADIVCAMTSTAAFMCSAATTTLSMNLSSP